MAKESQGEGQRQVGGVGGGLLGALVSSFVAVILVMAAVLLGKMSLVVLACLFVVTSLIRAIIPEKWEHFLDKVAILSTSLRLMEPLERIYQIVPARSVWFALTFPLQAVRLFVGGGRRELKAYHRLLLWILLVVLAEGVASWVRWSGVYTGGMLWKWIALEMVVVWLCCQGFALVWLTTQIQWQQGASRRGMRVGLAFGMLMLVGGSTIWAVGQPAMRNGLSLQTLMNQHALSFLREQAQGDKELREDYISRLLDSTRMFLRFHSARILQAQRQARSEKEPELVEFWRRLNREYQEHIEGLSALDEHKKLHLLGTYQKGEIWGALLMPVRQSVLLTFHMDGEEVFFALRRKESALFHKQLREKRRIRRKQRRSRRRSYGRKMQKTPEWIAFVNRWAPVRSLRMDGRSWKQLRLEERRLVLEQERKTSWLRLMVAWNTLSEKRRWSLLLEKERNESVFSKMFVLLQQQTGSPVLPVTLEGVKGRREWGKYWGGQKQIQPWIGRLGLALEAMIRAHFEALFEDKPPIGKAPIWRSLNVGDAIVTGGSKGMGVDRHQNVGRVVVTSGRSYRPGPWVVYRWSLVAIAMQEQGRLRRDNRYRRGLWLDQIEREALALPWWMRLSEKNFGGMMTLAFLLLFVGGVHLLLVLVAQWTLPQEVWEEEKAKWTKVLGASDGAIEKVGQFIDKLRA